MASQTGDSSPSFLLSSSALSGGCESSDGHEGSVRIVTPTSRTAMVWKYFRFPRQPHGHIDQGKTATCRICKTAVVHAGGTTNLKNHLIIWHRVEYDELFSSSSGQENQPTLRNFTKPSAVKSLPSTVPLQGPKS